MKSGHFYVDKGGHVWCCYQIDPTEPPCGAASCVRILDHRLEYFYIDGRYDSKGEREHTLVREMPFKEAWVDETYHVKWSEKLTSTDYIARNRGL